MIEKSNRGQGNISVWSKRFICICLAQLIQNVASNSVNSLVTSYGGLLGGTPMAVGVLAGLYYGVAFFFRPVSGPAQMRYDKKKLLMAAYAIGVLVHVGYTLSALSEDLLVFTAFRFLSGVQASFLSTLTLTIAADVLPEERMASGLGYFGLATTIGPTIGIAVRDFGAAQWGNAGGYGLLFALVTVLYLLTLIPCAMISAQPPAAAESRGTRWYANIVDFRVVMPAVIMLLIYMPYMLFTNYMVPYAGELGIGGIQTFFLFFALTVIVSRPVTGRLMDRFGLFPVLIPGAVLFLLSFAGVSLAASLPAMLAWAVVAALGFGAVQPGVQTMCMQSTMPERKAVASNTLYFGMDLGCFAAPVIFGGWIYPLFSTYRSVYLAACLPVAIAIALLLLYRPRFVKWRGEQETKKIA